MNTAIRSVEALNVELPAQSEQIVDQVFRVTLSTGTKTLLHLEFQGRSSHRPMRWRMLEYMLLLVALIQTEDLMKVARQIWTKAERQG